ncbi:MAG: hypothetical protein K2M23_02220, partial [Alphaproteobacteria bacterium]|nr:hypothetical protein [Alphaproteobacteria bacterium]
DMSYPDMSEIKNFNTDGQAQADAAYNMATRYLNQDFEKQKESLASDLANKGIPVGSAAYNSAMQNLNDSQNMALSQAADNAIFSGQNYAQNQLNLLGSKANTLLNGTASQISNINNLTAGINNPLNSIVSGVGGEFGNNYNNQFNSAMNKYNQKMASKNAAISALGSVAGSVGGAIAGGMMR